MKYTLKVIEPTPWSFTIEFDEGKAKRNGYDIETLYDYTDRNVSRYGCVRIAQGTWRASEGNEVESQPRAVAAVQSRMGHAQHQVHDRLRGRLR